MRWRVACYERVTAGYICPLATSDSTARESAPRFAAVALAAPAYRRRRRRRQKLTARRGWDRTRQSLPRPLLLLPRNDRIDHIVGVIVLVDITVGVVVVIDRDARHRGINADAHLSNFLPVLASDDSPNSLSPYPVVSP